MSGRIVQLVSDIDELNGGGIPIDVYQTPKRASRFDATEKYPLFFAVDPEMDVTSRRNVVVQYGTLAAKSFR